MQRELQLLWQDFQNRSTRAGEAPRGPDAPASRVPLQVSGGITAILQGDAGNPARFGGNSTAGEMSADLFITGSVGQNGRFLLRFDTQPGDGLTKLPPLFTNPDDNSTGTNNDVETWSNKESLNINEIRYEQDVGPDWFTLVFGEIDLTAFFDQNNYANNERDQFIAQQFANNSTIDWGGSANFFGPGIVAYFNPQRFVNVALGWFSGDQRFDNMFNQPFLIGQLSFDTHNEKRPGVYRLYAWTRRTPHCQSSNGSSLFLDCELIPADQQLRLDGGNSGVGISMDQRISPSIGVWSRVGFEDPKVAQFDKAINVGVDIAMAAAGRAYDHLGIAYGLTMPSRAYASATGYSSNEHYAELYYKYVISGDGFTTGFHLTPDIQIIAHAGGNGVLAPVVVYGVRGQAHF